MTDSSDQSPLVHFVSPGNASGVLKFVEYPNGVVAILCNDQLVSGLRWRVDQIEEGVTAFRELCAKGLPRPHDNKTAPSLAHPPPPEHKPSPQ